MTRATDQRRVTDGAGRRVRMRLDHDFQSLSWGRRAKRSVRRRVLPPDMARDE